MVANCHSSFSRAVLFVDFQVPSWVSCFKENSLPPVLPRFLSQSPRFSPGTLCKWIPKAPGSPPVLFPNAPGSPPVLLGAPGSPPVPPRFSPGSPHTLRQPQNIQNGMWCSSCHRRSSFRSVITFVPHMRVPFAATWTGSKSNLSVSCCKSWLTNPNPETKTTHYSAGIRLSSCEEYRLKLSYRWSKSRVPGTYYSFSTIFHIYTPWWNHDEMLHKIFIMWWLGYHYTILM